MNRENKFLTFDIALQDYCAIICGKTDTAIKWAQEFLKRGIKVMLQFKELPEELKQYRKDIRRLDDDFHNWNQFEEDRIAVIATGDLVLDDILADYFHALKVKWIMSDTPGRFNNIKFPGEKEKISIPTEETINGKPVIKVGVFEEDLSSKTLNMALNQLRDNFPDFIFEIKRLKIVDVDNYDLNFDVADSRLDDELNSPYNKSFNALYRENIDLIFLDGSKVGRIHPELDYSPNLVKRIPNDIIMIAPDVIETIFDLPENFPVYSRYVVNKEELKSLKWIRDQENPRYPKDKILSSSRDIKKLIERNSPIAILTSFPEFLENSTISLDEIERYGFSITFPPIAPITSQGLTIGLSRKDNPSKALARLKKEAEKRYPDQRGLFNLEKEYSDELMQYFGSFFDYSNSGGFIRKDNQYIFRGYAIEIHGVFRRADYVYRDSLKEASDDMFDFINSAISMY